MSIFAKDNTETPQFMKTELLSATITILMFQINQTFIAVLGIVATLWTILNQYSLTKRKIIQHHDGSVKKYLKFLIKSKTNKTKKE